MSWRLFLLLPELLDFHLWEQVYVQRLAKMLIFQFSVLVTSQLYFLLPELKHIAQVAFDEVIDVLVMKVILKIHKATYRFPNLMYWTS